MFKKTDPGLCQAMRGLSQSVRQDKDDPPDPRKCLVALTSPFRRCSILKDADLHDFFFFMFGCPEAYGVPRPGIGSEPQSQPKQLYHSRNCQTWVILNPWVFETDSCGFASQPCHWLAEQVPSLSCLQWKIGIIIMSTSEDHWGH